MKTVFSKDSWNKEDFTQVTSMHTDGRVPFMQEDNCIVNDFPRGEVENLKQCNYISLLAKEGFNVWEIHGAKTFKAAYRNYSVPEKETITLKVKVLEDALEVSLCRHTDKVMVERLPKVFRAGITACEGVNRFYSFTTEHGKAVEGIIG